MENYKQLVGNFNIDLESKLSDIEKQVERDIHEQSRLKKQKKIKADTDSIDKKDSEVEDI
jgi:hypothetical protein